MKNSRLIIINVFFIIMLVSSVKSDFTVSVKVASTLSDSTTPSTGDHVLVTYHASGAEHHGIYEPIEFPVMSNVFSVDSSGNIVESSFNEQDYLYYRKSDGNDNANLLLVKEDKMYYIDKFAYTINVDGVEYTEIVGVVKEYNDQNFGIIALEPVSMGSSEPDISYTERDVIDQPYTTPTNSPNIHEEDTVAGGGGSTTEETFMCERVCGGTVRTNPSQACLECRQGLGLQRGWDPVSTAIGKGASWLFKGCWFRSSC